MTEIVAELRDPAGHLAGKLVRLRDGRMAVEIKCGRGGCECGIQLFDAKTGILIAENGTPGGAYDTGPAVAPEGYSDATLPGYPIPKTVGA